jgi:aminoglycoside phosphotransferase (APT) family kinase protein
VHENLVRPDLGLLMFYWRQDGEATPVLTPAPSMLPGFPPRSYLADRYAKRTGADLSDLTAYIALAHFKFAVIAQDLSARNDRHTITLRRAK